MGKSEVSKRPLVYPPVVLAHIIENLKYYFEPKMKDRNSVDVHYSVQLNGHPHIGTLTSLSTAFVVGEYASNAFKIPAVLKFEALENAPTDKEVLGGKEYCKMHSHSFIDGIAKSEIYMKSFREVLDSLSFLTGVDYETEYYEEFQKKPFVRKTLLDIIEGKEKFIPYISPYEKRLRIRFPCPNCKLMEKTAKDSTIVEKNSVYDITYETACPNHGVFKVNITPQNQSLVDFNTPIRNVIKEAKFIEDAKKIKAANLMVDGGDWAGMAFQNMQSLGLLGYQIGDLPLRIFTPIIEDWSGAKLSKSIYVKEGTYRDVPEEFLNYRKFSEKFGKQGLEITLNEAREWVLSPKKLFRNYSVDYLRNVFKI